MTQWTQEQLSAAYAARQYSQIEEARASGALAVVLGGKAPLDPGAILSDDDVHQLYEERRYAEIDQARSEGRIASMTDEGN